jgi:hypothetical protein
MTLAGFPHSGISGSTPTCGSPKLIAAYHALPRLSVPRHPPCALLPLDRISLPGPPASSHVVLSSPLDDFFHVTSHQHPSCQSALSQPTVRCGAFNLSLFPSPSQEGRRVARASPSPIRLRWGALNIQGRAPSVNRLRRRPSPSRVSGRGSLGAVRI